jgi:F-type H+-transporting ATPase subunit b
MHQAIISAATEGGTNPLVPNPWEMLVVFAGFAVLMFIVVKYVVPMFEKTFAERAEAIEGGIAKAEKAQAEASAALEEYKQQLTDAPLKPTASARKHAPKVPRSLQS